MIVLAYFGMCNTKHKKHWHHVDKTKYVGNKWLKAHEREREGEKKIQNYGTRVSCLVPKKEKREKGNHRGIPLPCAYRRPPPTPAHTKGRGAQEAGKNPRRKWWSLFPDSKNEIKNKKQRTRNKKREGESPSTAIRLPLKVEYPPHTN